MNNVYFCQYGYLVMVSFFVKRLSESSWARKVIKFAAMFVANGRTEVRGVGNLFFPPSPDEWVLVLMTLSRPAPDLPASSSHLSASRISKLMTPVVFPASIQTWP